MSENVLEKIIKKKIERIDLLKKTISLKSLNEKINENKSFINFKDKIQKNIDSNKISLRGCCIDPGNPAFKCKSCGEEFGGLDKFLNDEFINDDL